MASVNEEADIDDNDKTGNPLIDGLLAKYHWSFSAREDFRFTIPDSHRDFDDTRDGLVNDYPDDAAESIDPMNAWMVDAVRGVIAQYSDILNFEITEEEDNNVDTQLRFAVFSPSPDDAIAYGHHPTDDGLGDERANWMSGDSFFSNSYFTNHTYLDADGHPAGRIKESVGTWQYKAILKATGEALGLKLGDSADDDSGNPALPRQFDTLEFTVMTNRGHFGQAPQDGPSVIPDGNYAQTLMMLDIQALQSLYGADFTTRSADTVYSWDTTGKYAIDGVKQWVTDTKIIFLTIWDGGGVDTYDFSAFTTDETIDLTPGGWSNLGTQLADLGTGAGKHWFARGNVFNALQYQGDVTDLRSLIENAVGGSGNDGVLGNIAANRLDGGAGDDTLMGGDGDDVLLGGRGRDMLVGGAGFDAAEYSASRGEDIVITPLGDDPSAGRWKITGASEAAGDTLRLVEGFRFGEGADKISTEGATAAFSFYLDGRGGGDTISGAAGNDVLIGGGGRDVLSGLAGDDTLIGGSASDTLKPGDGKYTVFGSADGGVGDTAATILGQNDVLVLDRSKDPDGNTVSSAGGPGRFSESDGSTAQGVARLDYTGGVGTDAVEGGIGGDKVLGAEGGDSLRGAAGGDLLDGGGGDDTLIGGSGFDGDGDGNDTLLGGAGFDRMFGGDGNDWIETGGGGDQAVNGENGNDTLIGSDDAEAFTGGNGNDSIVAGGGDDRIEGDLVGVFAPVAGNDTIFAGLGNDTVDPGAGVESLDGGKGDFDVLIMNRSSMSEGVSFFLNGPAGSDGTTAANFEMVIYNGGSGADTVRGWNNGDVITGNGGKDVLDGGGGDDTITGGSGFNGDGDGNDTIRGGAGFDRMFGGEGNDRIETGGGGDQVVEGQNGNDTLIGSDDAEIFTGGRDNDSILAFGGDDRLFGDLDGGAGKDTLRGGLGNDTLEGGDGADVLIFEKDGGVDVVTGFDSDPAGGQDLMNVKLLGFKNFASMLASGVTIKQSGADTIIDFKHDDATIVLSGVLKSTIDGSDFLF